jgi:hypothetical protein
MKDPVTYGAIPTDCYSHTPAHAGAQQPGMTGQVKEEVLTRFGELGIRIVDGRVRLSPGLIPPDELFTEFGAPHAGTTRFTLCSVPMTLSVGASDEVTVEGSDGRRDRRDGSELTSRESRDVFTRSGAVTRVDWTIGPDTVSRWAALTSSSNS